MSNTSVEATLDMSTMEKAHRLAAVAEVLKANHMPQETINMVLAARCGLPMAKVDPKSPCFLWVDEPEEAETATPASATTPEKPNLSVLAWDIVGTLGEIELVEGLSVLTMAAGIFAGPRRYSARVVINENVEVAGGRVSQ